MNSFNHEDVIRDIKSYIKKSDKLTLHPTGSLPIGSNRTTRLTTVDILVTEEKNISHIIEIETKSDGTTIAGKLILVNEAIKMMVDDNSQSKDIKPKVIYLYDPKFADFGRVKYRAGKIFYHLKFIEIPIIMVYTNDWYKHL